MKFKDILNEWRKIGQKGSELEKKWRQSLIKKNSNVIKEFENINLQDLEKKILKEKEKYFESKPSMATRQCSSSVIEIVSNILPQLIGGSADLSGSNNTKTQSSKKLLIQKILMEIIFITELENMVWQQL